MPESTHSAAPISFTFNRMRPACRNIVIGLLFSFMVVAIVLDYTLVKESQLEAKQSTQLCPPTVRQYSKYLCAGVDLSDFDVRGNAQGVSEGFVYNMEFTKYQKYFDLDLVFVPTKTGKTTFEMEIHVTRENYDHDGFMNFNNKIELDFETLDPVTKRFQGAIPVLVDHYHVQIVRAKSSNIPFKDVFLRPVVGSEDFGFVQLFFTSVWSICNSIVAAVVMIVYFAKQTPDREYGNAHKIAIGMVALFISPVYIFTLHYAYSPLMIAQYLLKCAFLGYFEFFTLKATNMFVHGGSFLHRMPVIAGFFTFLVTFINEFVGVTSAFDNISVYNAKAGLGVLSAVLLFCTMLLRVVGIYQVRKTDSFTKFATFVGIWPIWYELLLLGIITDDIHSIGNFVSGINCFDLVISIYAWVTIWWYAAFKPTQVK